MAPSGYLSVNRKDRPSDAAAVSGASLAADGYAGFAESKLDHVMIMVRDLRAATDTFSRLGFRVRAGGRFSVGIENAIVPFGVDGPYLELVGIHQPGDPSLRDNEEFLAQGEGAMYVGLEVGSAEGVASRLRELGLEVAGPLPQRITVPGYVGEPPIIWESVVIPHGTSPRSDPVFFTEYHRDGQRQLMAANAEYAHRYGEERRIPHPNGADGLRSVWLAADDLASAGARYDRWGLRRSPERRLLRPPCRAVEFALGRGSLWLMDGSVRDGPLARLLALHGSPLEIPGVSLEVPSLDVALGAMPAEVARTLETYDAPSGPAVAIPPQFAHGLWVEIVERPHR